MKQRRLARECAVQFLFQHDLNPPANLPEALEAFWADRPDLARDHEPEAPSPIPEGAERLPAEPEAAEAATVPAPAGDAPTADEAVVRAFAEQLIRGTLEHRDGIDREIERVSQNWKLSRLAAVDRNVIRLAIFEMKHRGDIPPVVSINEAVDIARKFSTGESGRFVNGLLDRIKNELTRPARTPAPKEA
ncbi:MAG: transcription antitermination factor NusB [Limisphaerales bacterium]